MRVLNLLAVAALGLSATFVLADDKKAGDRITDQEFIAKAASGGMYEVKSSQLALQMGSSAEVKKLAQHMINDHTKANQELAALLTRKGQAVPAAMDQKHLDMVNQLARLQSGQFDKAYLEQQLKAHQETVKLFEAASKSLTDAQLKAWATQTLPTLKQHLQMVERAAGGAHRHE